MEGHVQLGSGDNENNIYDGSDAEGRARMETISQLLHKTGKYIKINQKHFLSPKDTKTQLKIMATELSWDYPTNELALSYRSLSLYETPWSHISWLKCCN